MRIDCCVSYFQKQLIGLLPRDIECLFYYAPDSDVYFWTIDGIAANDALAVNAAVSVYGYHYEAFLDLNLVQKFVLSYVGTEPPTYLPTILDGNGDPVTWTLTNCCTKLCLEGTFNSNDYYYLITGYGWTAALGEYVSDFTVGQMEQYIQGLFGTQTVYTATDNGDGTWYVKIDNAYVCNPPLAWSGDNVNFTDMVPCGTPVCLYTTGSYTDTTGNNCFTLPGYDFNGQGIDFTAAANVYGGYAIQYGNSGTIPYGFDICSIIQFSYIGYSQPADVIVNDPIFGIINLPLGFQFCEKGCLTTNSILLKNTYDGIFIIGYINLPFSSFGTNTLDFVNDMVGAETYLNLILSKFCPGATCNVTSDGADYFTITFNDIYYNTSLLDFQLIDSNGIPSITTSLVPC